VGTYYLDTSALVKRYTREQGTAWIVGLTAPHGGHDLFTVRLTGPELIAALTRKARMGGLAVVDADRRARAFRRHWQRRYLVIEVTATLAAVGVQADAHDEKPRPAALARPSHAGVVR
jgi:predicted nucleic acid-binding protein